MAGTRRTQDELTRRLIDQVIGADVLRAIGTDVLGVNQRLSNIVGDATAPLLRDWNRTMRPVLEALASTGLSTAKLSEQARSAVQNLAARGWPPNWGEPHVSTWRPAVECIRDDHLPLVWLPQRDLALHLATLDDHDARQRLLVERRRTLAAEIDRISDEVVTNQLADVARALREVATELRTGRYLGAQALSAVVLAELAKNTFGHNQLKLARESFDRGDPMSVSIRNLRTSLVLLPAAMALRNAAEPRSGYNRHLTVHELTADQYTPPHAVRAAMVAASLAREADRLIADRLLEEEQAS